ncbi:4202_t:CDS:2 [Dentiscutata heterogama]|uniref:4202_t:CDS:1 n=1 Tax=Dentiscutata heterogama TaxID=1316150 RepID=A0ACA9LZF2_9GLOM|nr:4202_t:CDS:2 [Dentiscutata heterogama]
MWLQSDSNLDIKIIARSEPNIKEFSAYSSVLRKNILNTSAEDSLNILVASDKLKLLELAECAQKHLVKEFSQCFVLPNLVITLYSLFDSANLSLLDEVAMICLLERDDLELEETEIWNYLIKWGISKFFDNDVTVKNISSWSDEHFMILKETISHYIPLIRYYHIPKNYINKQIKI